MYWNSVLKEVLNKNSTKQNFLFTNLAATKKCEKISKKKSKRKSKQSSLRIYFLGKKYPGAYFTRREAECMALLLKGKTVTTVAATLSLSPRTVEFYLKNMKIKVRCRTRYELIEIVQNSSFVQQHMD